MAGTAWHGATDEVQALVDDLAGRLGRSVVVNDPLVRLMYASRHYADEDPVRVRAVLQRDAGAEVIAFVLGHGVTCWSRPGRLPGEPRIELLPRLCVPLRDRGELLGMLMVIDAEDALTTAEIAQIETTASAITALLSARACASDADRRACENAVRLTVGSDTADRRTGRAQLLSAGFTDQPYVVAIRLEVTSELHTAAQVELALRSALGSFETTARVQAADAVSGNRAILLQLRRRQATPDELQEHARQLREALHRALGREAHAVVGVGGHAAGLAEASATYREAGYAARGARLLPQLGGIGLWDELGEFAVLLAIPDEALTESLIPAALRVLKSHEAGPRLHETLGVYLEQAGSVPRTAAKLHLHRTTLHYRLRQIREITGLDLDDGRNRLMLHLGLRVEKLLDPRG